MASVPDLAAALMAHRTTADVVVEVLPQRMLRFSLEADHSIGQTFETSANGKQSFRPTSVRAVGRHIEAPI